MGDGDVANERQFRLFLQRIKKSCSIKRYRAEGGKWGGKKKHKSQSGGGQYLPQKKKQQKNKLETTKKHKPFLPSPLYPHLRDLSNRTLWGGRFVDVFFFLFFSKFLFGTDECNHEAQFLF